MSHKILAVDDSASMRMLLSMTLSQKGYDVAEACDGMSALDWLTSNVPDLVITDINMPRMDGFQLIEQLRLQSRFKDVPILVLTSEASSDQIARARLSGAAGWIVKPFDAEKLSSTIRLILH